jgi:hypothetical protein
MHLPKDSRFNSSQTVNGGVNTMRGMRSPEIDMWLGRKRVFVKYAN